MAKFIEVTILGNGVKSLINVNQILEVSSDENGNAYLETVVITPKARKGVITYRFTCKESYAEIKCMLLAA